MKVWILILILLAGCAEQAEIDHDRKLGDEVKEMGLNITSVFEMNGRIPGKYTCDGDNINPPLDIYGIPEEAKMLVLIVDDPDAPMGTFDHWVVWNIKPGNIAENSVPGTEGNNGGGEASWTGPCPPSGEHRYFFKVYALETELDMPEGSSKKAIEEAITGHILDQGELIGLYSRE